MTATAAAFSLGDNSVTTPASYPRSTGATFQTGSYRNTRDPFALRRSLPDARIDCGRSATTTRFRAPHILRPTPSDRPPAPDGRAPGELRRAVEVSSTACAASIP